MMSFETKRLLIEAICEVLNCASWAIEQKAEKLVELIDTAIEEQVNAIAKEEVRS